MTTTPTSPQAMAAASLPPGLVPGRSCGTCTMCCKTFRIPEVEKAAGQWCRHVLQGRGCGIHATRPTVCRTFFCHWLANAGLGPEWQPDKSKFVLYTEMEGRRLVVACDAGAPTAWRKPAYYPQFKQWASRGPERNIQVLVFNGPRATAVLPDRDVDLGVVNVGDKVIYSIAAGRVEVEVRREVLPQPNAGTMR